MKQRKKTGRDEKKTQHLLLIGMLRRLAHVYALGSFNTIADDGWETCKTSFYGQI